MENAVLDVVLFFHEDERFAGLRSTSLLFCDGVEC